MTMPVPHHLVFTRRMPFMPPNQQRQSIEGITEKVTKKLKVKTAVEKLNLSHWLSQNVTRVIIGSAN